MGKYMKIKLIGGGNYIQPIDEIRSGLSGDIDGAEIGQKWELELVEMDDGAYKKSPEFSGH